MRYPTKINFRYFIAFFTMAIFFLMVEQKNIQALEVTTEIAYTITISNPESHAMEVEIRLQNFQIAALDPNFLVIGVHDSVDADNRLKNVTAKNSQTGKILEVTNRHFTGSKKAIKVDDADDITISYLISQESADEILIDQNYAVLSLYRYVDAFDRTIGDIFQIFSF